MNTLREGLETLAGQFDRFHKELASLKQSAIISQQEKSN